MNLRNKDLVACPFLPSSFAVRTCAFVKAKKFPLTISCYLRSKNGDIDFTMTTGTENFRRATEESKRWWCCWVVLRCVAHRVNVQKCDVKNLAMRRYVTDIMTTPCEYFNMCIAW